MTEIRSVQEALRNRGGVFTSRTLWLETSWGGHKVLTALRWRGAKIHLMKDVVRWEELAQSSHRERAEWDVLDDALTIYEDYAESLAEVPMDMDWRFREDVNSGPNSNETGSWVDINDWVAQKMKSDEERAERKEKKKERREAKRAKRAVKMSLEMVAEDRYVLTLEKESGDRDDGLEVGNEVDGDAMDVDGTADGAENDEKKANEVDDQLKNNRSTDSGEKDFNATLEQIVPPDSTISPVAAVPDVEMEDIQIDSNMDVTTATASKSDTADPVGDIKGEPSGTTQEQTSPGIRTIPSASPSQSRKRAASSDLSGPAPKKVHYSDVVTLSPERLNCTPTLFPGRGISLDSPDATEASRLTAAEIQARAAKPLDTEPTYQNHSNYVWRKLRRGSRKFHRPGSSYTPGRWASPTGYEKANTSYYHIEWNDAEEAWEKEQEDAWEEEKVFKTLKVISGAYLLSRVVPTAFWCYQQAKIAKIAELVAEIKLPAEQNGEGMHY